MVPVRLLDQIAEFLTGMDADGDRAHAFNGSAQTAVEDAAVLALCERHGFGAVMDSAARQWFARDRIGSFVVGPCAGTVRGLQAVVKEAVENVCHARIVGIHRGHGEGKDMVYGELRTANGNELLIAARLDYILEKAQERSWVIDNLAEAVRESMRL